MVLVNGLIHNSIHLDLRFIKHARLAYLQYLRLAALRLPKKTRAILIAQLQAMERHGPLCSSSMYHKSNMSLCNRERSGRARNSRPKLARTAFLLTTIITTLKLLNLGI